MKMKRFASVLVVLSMLLSLCVPTAFAAGGDYVAGLTVTKVDDAKLSVSCDIGPSGASATIQGVQTFIVAYDTNVFKPLLKNGNVITGITTTPTSKAMAYYEYEDPDSALTWSTKVYVYQSADGKTGFLLIQPAEGDSGSTLTTTVSLAKVYLGFQDGKGYSDVTKQTVRFATSSELAGMSEDKAVRIANDGEFFEWTNGGSGDTLTTIPTVEASGFDFAKAPLAGSVYITGTVKVGEELTADVSSLNDTTNITYQWKRDGAAISGATNSSYTLTAADAGCKITVAVTANSASSYGGTVTSAETAAVANAAQSAPALNSSDISKTDTTITVTANSGWEYSKDGGSTWQSDNVFTDLTPNTSYQICVRLAAKTGYDASPASSVRNVTTDKTSASDPVAPVVTETTDTSITVQAVSGQKYMIKKATDSAPNAGDSGWAVTVVFTGLEPNTAYRVYTYIPESSTVAASAVVYTEATTDKTSITDTLVPVSGLSKTYTAEAQEPTFSGSLTKDTDYTVSYSVKNAGEGQLQDGKPCGAGTYVVTVTGTGSYGGSFTKDFTIGKKEVTVTPDADQTKTYGDTDPALTYTTGLTGELATAFNAAKIGALARVEGEDVGNYNINLGTLAAGDNFDVKLSTTTVNFSITAKDVSETRTAEEQNVVKGVGDFTEPTFGSVTGTLAYSYDTATTYEGVKAKLAALSTDATGTINYTYTASGNYSGTITGSINFTVVNVIFDIQAGAITVTSNPTYGDKWSNIVSYDSSKITAKVGTNVCDNPTFTLQNDSEYPNYGSQTYTITFSGTINGVNYTDVTVKSESVTIAKKEVTVAAGTYKVSKEYDGYLTAGTASGTLSVSGILPADSGVTVKATPVAYTSNSVGAQTTMDIDIALNGTGSENYKIKDDATTVTVPCEITARPITIASATATNRDYEAGNVSVEADVTLKYAISALDKDTDYTVTGEMDDANAGSGKTVNVTVTLTGSAATNYTLTPNTTTTTVTINKIDYTISTPITGSAKYGTTGSVDLSSYKADGGSFGTVTKTDTEGVLSGTPAMNGDSLEFTFVNDAGKATKTATIKVPVTGATNYNNYEISVEVTVLDKSAQSDFKFASATQAKTYGDADFTVAATGAVAGSTVTYASSATDVATVESGTGKVHILKVGTTVITAAASATDDYAAKEVQYTLTVSKKDVTVAPKSFTITKGSAIPTFELVYTGLVGSDTLTPSDTPVFTCYEADGTTPVSTTTAAGAYTITWTNEGATTFTGADNYNVTKTATGTLTINNPAPSGGGGGVSTYAITISSAKNGDVTSSHKSASKGTTVTLTVDPDKGYTLETITVTDGSGKEVKLTEKNGKYTFTMPASKVTVKATFMEDNSMLNFFVDVPADAYYYDAVLWAAKNGITGGVDDTHFAPNATCTRAQAVTFLWRAAGSPAPKSSENPFTDVKAGSYYYDAVLWAVENGITNGTSATAFSPNATCSRAQIVTFLWRSQKSPAADTVNPFTDVAADSYYANAVVWAAENGITGGTSATTFSPNNNCTRAQIVTFLFRCLGE